MMKTALAEGFMSKWKLWLAKMLVWLAQYGIWGIGAVALLDSSSIPVPMDLILAGAVWADKPHFWLVVLMASAGSAVGGLVPFLLGRAGGELFLLKRMGREKMEKMRDRFEKQEFLAVLIPSMLPPPTPWKIFVFGAGVFEMRILPFMLAVFSGRLIRWMLLSLLVLKLGPGAADMVAHHALKAFLIVLLAALVGFGIWWWRRKKSPQE
jgi:membrane protein YqaA with SNARE-associated domain